MKQLGEYSVLHKGTAVYFDVIRGIYDVFSSKDPSFTLKQRISTLATAVFFVRGWNAFLAKKPKHSKAGSELCQTNNGLSREACIDLEVCAGEFVTVVAILADNPQFRGPVMHGFDPELLVC